MSKKKQHEVQASQDGAIRLVPVADLQPYARNSRKHSDAQIAQLATSIEEFGLVGAIVVRDGVIAKGHGILRAIEELTAEGKPIYPPPGKAKGAQPYPAGMVPIIDAAGWTDTQFRAFIIADNKLALNSGWNYETLIVELSGIKEAEEISLSDLGFTNIELNALLGEALLPPIEDGRPDIVDEWQDMPEYKNDDKSPLCTIHVHFATAEDVHRFGELIGQEVHPKTRYIWFPEIQIESYADKRYK